MRISLKAQDHQYQQLNCQIKISMPNWSSLCTNKIKSLTSKFRENTSLEDET